MSICKKAFKTKEGKLRKGVLASVVLSLAILGGGIQWFATTSTPTEGNIKKEQIQPSFNNGATAQPTNHDFNERKFDHDGREGKGGHGGSSNAFLVALNYFAIWAAIIIPAYYIEKRILRNKRKSSGDQPKTS
ncbi:hypothetical protein [Neobacillus cucumis]|uniref:hypothetical protein n=1 Tax=Neobacillus cucumis TaxID=1740721 RepID=UPI00215581B5|nr:hypothetical protein [Neobacillus cucumis]